MERVDRADRSVKPEVVGKEINCDPGSKLAIVRAALLNNPEVTVVGEIGEQSFPALNGNWAQTVAIVVAPRHSLSSDKVDAFAQSLVPNVDPTGNEPFGIISGDHAPLYYDDKLGDMKFERTSEYRLTEATFADAIGRGNKFAETVRDRYTTPVLRRTSVLVFANGLEAKAHLAAARDMFRNRDKRADGKLEI